MNQLMQLSYTSQFEYIQSKSRCFGVTLIFFFHFAEITDKQYQQLASGCTTPIH